MENRLKDQQIVVHHEDHFRSLMDQICAIIGLTTNTFKSNMICYLEYIPQNKSPNFAPFVALKS